MGKAFFVPEGEHRQVSFTNSFSSKNLGVKISVHSQEWRYASVLQFAGPIGQSAWISGEV
jgi:hypothetical protein